MSASDRSFHLFLSYARADNKVRVNLAGEGWITAFVAELKRRHAAYSGRELRIFFDQDSIEDGTDWKRRLGEGLRQSRLFLAFLSPNYLTSKNCLWEWEEYLRREHSAARGDDGLTPIYFVTPADLRFQDDQGLAEWLRNMEQRYPWFEAREAQFTSEAEKTARAFAADLNRRQKSATFELHPWFERGPEVLRELDAAERASDVKRAPRAPADDLRSLAERLNGLDRHIARRLDRLALADLAPGNITRSHEHFVGRHRELRELHEIMLTGGPQSGGRGMGGRGMIAATFAPGGLGKTALARQYAHAYAEFYAAGGTWEIGCEGQKELGFALKRLVQSTQFQQLAWRDRRGPAAGGELLTTPLSLSQEQENDPALALEAILGYLERVTAARRAILVEELSRSAAEGRGERHTPPEEPPELKQPRALLILDNVDQPELLSGHQVAQLPAKDWLEIIVTTRLHPSAFGGGDRTFAHVELGTLPEADGVQLLADFQPGGRFALSSEEEAARRIVRALGGWTIAVEIAAAFIGDLAKNGRAAVAAAFYAELEKNGLAWVDDLAGRTAFDQTQRHSEASDQGERERQNRVGTLIAWSVARLSAPARTALEFASLFQPDAIPLSWLHVLTASVHPEVKDKSLTNDVAWPAVWTELRGLRLLHPAGEVEAGERQVEREPNVVRIHRVVAQHVSRDGLTERFAALDKFLDAFTTRFEHEVGNSDDAWLRAQHPWLIDQLDHLLSTRTPTPTLLSSAGVSASYEGQHRSLARAMELTSRILAAAEGHLAANLQSAEAQRDVSVSLSKLADFLALRGQAGDGKKALEYYERSLAVREQLVEANPQSAPAQRDVSVSLNKLADFLAQRGQTGDGKKALEYYERSLAVREQLVEANPQSAPAQRDVSVSLNKLANFLASRGLAGDGEKALGYCQRSLAVAEQLAEASPQSAQAQRDVVVGLLKLADYLAQRGQTGDGKKALEYYEQSLAVLERLAEANPQSAQAQRDVSVSLSKLADYLARRGQAGDGEKALGYYERELAICERLAEANAQSAEAQRDLKVSLERLAGLEGRRTGGQKKALELQRRALEIALRLRGANPQSVYFGRTAAVSFFLTYQRAQAAGQDDLAMKCLVGCYEVLDELISAGCTLDQQSMQLHAQLKTQFSSP
ncbi:MAG: toll/interleukin-1 receptor domain-containing protein [Opitutae bacterium]|nr:toll/interleukin-1 receptor domain-containing protein [Opitutae bacterium]